ncbi:MAG TPA: transposase [Desulfocapsa sulfexigens]|nr:transposase [Desulfocapsa sulfexigens]
MGDSAPCQNTTTVYHPRKPTDSPLYRLLLNHFDNFEQVCDQRFSHDYGFYRPVISEVVRAYLKCGDLKQGFARVRCPDCHYEYLLAFSCRGRWFCPSCHAKKVVQFGEVLRENILYPVPHRLYVFSIPIIIRKFFLYNRSLLARLTTCAADSLLTFFRTVLGLDDGVCGAVMTIQTFGDYAKWHPHIHSIVADGPFRRNGVFCVMPKLNITPLAELFRGSVLSMLKEEGVIDDAFIAMIMKWRHTSGFSVDNSVSIARDDDVGITNLAQYIIRSPFSIKKISYNDSTGMVVYRSKMTHGKNKKNFSISSAEEFIAAITQHIPEKNFQLVRYFGWYSNRMRGERAKQELADKEDKSTGNEIEIIDVSKYKPRKIPPPTWRECIKKVWEVDPLKCKHCQGEMKIISFINEPNVIRKILEHLDLWNTPEQPRPPPGKRFTLPQHNPCPPVTEQEEVFDDGWPGYEEPVFSVD